MIERLVRWLDTFFWEEVDSRLYAVVRICYGIAALVGIAQIFPSRYVYLSSIGSQRAGTTIWGVFPNSFFSQPIAPTLVDTELAVAVLAALFLTLGLFSRPAALITFLWHYSYAHQMTLFLCGWDTLLRVIGFVMVFSPLGSCWSLDRKLGLVKNPPERAFNYGLTIMRYQMALMYLATAWIKVKDQYWRDGTFFTYFIRSDNSLFPDLPLESWPVLSAIMTHGALITEILLPFLLLSSKYYRLGIAAGLALHLGIAATSIIWPFSVVAILLYSIFLREREVKEFFGERIDNNGGNSV